MKTYYVGSIPVSNELYHYGIKGQKWGIRRYQNVDGTLTAAGKERYGSNIEKISPMKLKRQILRNMGLGENRQAREINRKFDKEFEKIKSPFNATNYKETYKKIATFMKDYTKAQLRDLGYVDSDNAVAYLFSQKWYTTPYGYLFGRPIGIRR